jgi:Fe-S-cluster containining protein
MSGAVTDDSAAGIPWWAGGLRFSCLGCGRCCRGEPGVVLFTDEEMSLMAGELGIGADEFERLYVWRRYGKRSLRERANYDCIFLDGNHDRCRIFRSRPGQCRSFPFWPEVVKNKQTWDLYSKSCPGMDQGKLYDKLEITGFLL